LISLSSISKHISMIFISVFHSKFNLHQNVWLKSYEKNRCIWSSRVPSEHKTQSRLSSTSLVLSMSCKSNQKKNLCLDKTHVNHGCQEEFLTGSAKSRVTISYRSFFSRQFRTQVAANRQAMRTGLFLELEYHIISSSRHVSYSLCL
jgi:hypothetical protein